MKILHIASGDLWAGAEVQAYTQLSALHELGARTEAANTGNAHISADESGASGGVRVAAVLLNHGELAERLRARGIEVHVYPENQLNALQILLRLRRLMLDWRPDIVHTHRLKENILGALANRLAHAAPSVRTVHGANEYVAAGWRQLHKRVLHRLNNWTGLNLQQKMIAVSGDLHDKLAIEIPSEHLRTIENGVDVETVRAQVRPVAFRQAAPHARHIGIVGRLAAIKRIDIFLAMAVLLRAQRPDIDWRFHIFGDGALRDTLQAQARQCDISNIVVFHGHCRDIIPGIAGLDALVICSDHEGLPMTVLEAMALHTPIVAHAVGGLVDALDGYANGRLVATHAAASYAAAVVDLIEAPAASQYFCMDRFSAGANAGALLRLYAELLSNSSVAGRS